VEHDRITSTRTFSKVCGKIAAPVAGTCGPFAQRCRISSKPREGCGAGYAELAIGRHTLDAQSRQQLVERRGWRGLIAAISSERLTLMLPLPRLSDLTPPVEAVLQLSSSISIMERSFADPPCGRTC